MTDEELSYHISVAAGVPGKDCGGKVKWNTFYMSA